MQEMTHAIVHTIAIQWNIAAVTGLLALNVGTLRQPDWEQMSFYKLKPPGIISIL